MKIILQELKTPGDHNFIEVEDDNGKSINIGEWVKREDGLWEIQVKDSPELVVNTCGHGCVICAKCDYIPSSWKPAV